MSALGSTSGPTPPDFVMAEYLRELAPELSRPIALLFALRGCMQRVNANLLGRLGADALSPGRMQLVMVLWASRAPVPQSRLVGLLHTARASVSQLVETLVREGLVVTRPDPTHGRRSLVSLSPAGREVARSQLHDNAEHLRSAFATLSADEQRLLVGLLDRLCAAPAGAKP